MTLHLRASLHETCYYACGSQSHSVTCHPTQVNTRSL